MLYHRLIRPDWFLSRYIYCKLKDVLEFQNKNIIDFGCGVGSSSAFFSPSAYLGLDCDKRRVEYARKNHPGYNFTELVNNKLPVQDTSIDYIIIISVLHHIPSKDVHEYLKEFRRVLTPKGKIAVIEPCLYKKSYLSNFYMSRFDRGKFIRSEGEYLDMFSSLNYETQVMRRFSQLLLYKKLFFVAAPN